MPLHNSSAIALDGFAPPYRGVPRGPQEGVLVPERKRTIKDHVWDTYANTYVKEKEPADSQSTDEQTRYDSKQDSLAFPND